MSDPVEDQAGDLADPIQNPISGSVLLDFARWLERWTAYVYARANASSPHSTASPGLQSDEPIVEKAGVSKGPPEHWLALFKEAGLEPPVSSQPEPSADDLLESGVIQRFQEELAVFMSTSTDQLLPQAPGGPVVEVERPASRSQSAVFQNEQSAGPAEVDVSNFSAPARAVPDQDAADDIPPAPASGERVRPDQPRPAETEKTPDFSASSPDPQVRSAPRLRLRSFARPLPVSQPEPRPASATQPDGHPVEGMNLAQQSQPVGEEPGAASAPVNAYMEDPSALRHLPTQQSRSQPDLVGRSVQFSQQMDTELIVPTPRLRLKPARSAGGLPADSKIPQLFEAASQAASPLVELTPGSPDAQPTAAVQTPVMRQPAGQPIAAPRSDWQVQLPPSALQPSVAAVGLPGLQSETPVAQARPAPAPYDSLVQQPGTQPLPVPWNETLQSASPEVSQTIERQWSGSNEAHWPELPEPPAAPVRIPSYTDPARRQRIDREQSGGLWSA